MGLRFSPEGPDFPTPLVDALLDGQVLFLCGAGVSTPQLPGFGGLVSRVFEELGVSLTEGEEEARRAFRYEEVLGSLSRRLSNKSEMHDTVRRLLAVTDPNLEKHSTILRLSRNLDNRVALVTTNFDTFFERALENVSGSGSARKESFAGQALPLPGADDFGGIIHLHGRLEDPLVKVEATPLVLTSSEYGEAYMRSGWASRFLFDLVRCKTLVLVGYSASDAPIRYFLNVLEADRERFSDLKPVYALDAFDGEHIAEGDRWAPIAVRSLAYRRGRKGDADRHYALWRDLAALADLVEQPKPWRRERAREILAVQFDPNAELNLSVVSWLFSGKRDLWDVAITSITDARWFEFFTSQKLWSDHDASWVLAAWCALGWTDEGRLEAAVPWRRRFGGKFADALRNRMASNPPTSAIHQKAWGLLASESETPDGDLVAYRIAGKIRSDSCTDADLRAAVALLTPRATISEFLTKPPGRPKAANDPRRLSDLVYVDLRVTDRGSIPEIIDALRAKPERAKRILEIASEELRSTIALAHDIEFISPEWDQLDIAVPTVERHEQNEHRDGATQLAQLITDLYSTVAVKDPEAARLRAESWRQLQSLIGTRLYLHAMRDPHIFTTEEVAGAILRLDFNAFWRVRRELILLMAERLGDGPPALIEGIVARILAEAPLLYEELSDRVEGTNDWRPQVRDRDSWLRLTALKRAGCLTDAGAIELDAISSRHSFISGDFTEQDLFSYYSSGVRTIVGNPEPLKIAPPEERLPIAKQFAAAWDPDTQRNWSAYCGTDPAGALEALKLGPFDEAESNLWSELIGSLAWSRDGDQPSGNRPSVVRDTMECLATAPEDFLRQIYPRLTDLLPAARKVEGINTDLWWDNLWGYAELDHEPVTVDASNRFYDHVINTPAGRLTEFLIETINSEKSRSKKISPENRDRIRRVMTSDSAAGWLGRAALVNEAGFVHFLDPIGSVRFLRPWISKSDAQGASLRSVLVQWAQLGAKATRAYRSQLFLAVSESQASGETAARVALTLLRPLFIGALKGQEEKWGLSRLEVRNTLKAAAPSILEGAARAVRLWVTPTDLSPEEAWRNAVKPVFDTVWPRERRYRQPGWTASLAGACVAAGQAFPEALETVWHYLSPFEEDRNGLYFLTSSTAPEAFPGEVLRLLWMLCGPNSRGLSFDLGKVLDRLSNADPSLVNDRRYQWLEQRAVRYD